MFWCYWIYMKMHVTFVEYTYAIVSIYTYIQDIWKELCPV
jgi:hypothetical protein